MPVGSTILANLARRLPRRRGKLPSTELPKVIQRAYLREILELIRVARDLVEQRLIAELPSLMVNDSLVTDDRESDRVERILEGVRLEFGRRVSPERFVEIVRKAGWRTADVNRLRSAKQLEALVGIDLTGSDPSFAEHMAAWTKENVSLIKSIPEKHFSEIEQLTLRNITSGTRANTLALEIRSRFGVSESKAALIARDQTAKLNGTLTRKRQTAAGIVEYLFRTSGDDLVRTSHAVMEGRRCRWDDATVYWNEEKQAWRPRKEIGGVEQHPGQDYQCRCTAEPRLPGIEDEPAKREVEEPKRQARENPAPRPEPSARSEENDKLASYRMGERGAEFSVPTRPDGGAPRPASRPAAARRRPVRERQPPAKPTHKELASLRVASPGSSSTTEREYRIPKRP